MTTAGRRATVHAARRKDASHGNRATRRVTINDRKQTDHCAQQGRRAAAISTVSINEGRYSPYIRQKCPASTLRHHVSGEIGERSRQPVRTRLHCRSPAYKAAPPAAATKRNQHTRSYQRFGSASQKLS